MNNLIKLASIELDKPDDIVRTAGILRMLKNKFLSMFDNERAEKVNNMLDTTTNIKPLLTQTYRTIKKIENAINDLDLDDYNANINLLKQNLNELNEAIKNANEILPKGEDKNIEEVKQKEEKLPAAKSITVEEKKPERKDGAGVNLLNYKRERTELPDGAVIYKGIKTLSELGVTSKDILSNTEVGRQFKSSWAHTVRPKTDEESQKLNEDQSKLSEDDIAKIFYSKIPEMQITQLKGREINSIDDPRFGKKGTPKPGYMEVVVVSPVLQLPAPINFWKIKMKFFLIDKRAKADDPLKFKIYRQYVIAAIDDSRDETYLGKNVSNE